MNFFSVILSAFLLLNTAGTVPHPNKFINTSQEENPIRFSHTTLYVQNLEISTEFYTNVIGLKPCPEPFHDGRHSWFMIGDHSKLHVVQGAKEKIVHDINIHLAFSVKNLETFTNYLKTKNVKFGNWAGEYAKMEKRKDGVSQIYFQDPDGYWIEVNDDQD